MAVRGNLSSADRVVAVALGAVWLGGGISAVALGVMRGQWLLVVVGVGALSYAAAWLRVVARSRLLTWAELAAPWRRR